MIRKYFAELINKGNMLFFFFNLCLEACNFWNQETLFWSAITAYDVTHQFHQSCQEMGLSHNWMKQQDRTSYRKENDDCWSALERTLQARGKKKKMQTLLCATGNEYCSAHCSWKGFCWWQTKPEHWDLCRALKAFYATSQYNRIE